MLDCFLFYLEYRDGIISHRLIVVAAFYRLLNEDLSVAILQLTLVTMLCHI